MNAVIIYDGFDLGSNAYALLARAASRADADLQWTVKPWRLDLLLQAWAADVAFQDAEEAHVIVLAVRHPTDVPPSLLNWLEAWADRRRVQEAALAVFDGGSGDMLSATAIPELSQFAQRHGLSFISGNVNPVDDEPAVFGLAVPVGGRDKTPVLPQIFEQPIYEQYQAWGIND